MIAVHGLTPAGLAPVLDRLGAPAWRATQVLDWVYRRETADPAAMTTLPASLRSALATEVSGPSVGLAVRSVSADGTRKLAVRLDDGELVESVLIPDRHRLTLCISSQVGCAMGCRFCATARLGLRRHLRVDEIVGQVQLARREIAREPFEATALTNLVFMGMGEPLHNLDALVPALEILSAPWGLAISPRRITVSTVGLVPQMHELLDRTGVNLAVSLTATTDEGRRDLMPVARRYDLADLFGACRALPVPRRRRITIEYVMLDGVNDSDVDARRLVALLAGIRSKVNLIFFNPFPGAPFRPSPRDRVEAFQRVLLDRGVNATLRESRGADVAAACGQLAAQGTEAMGPGVRSTARGGESAALDESAPGAADRGAPGAWAESRSS
ncbi:MAG: 23S rRNA (adenine(2503)-C(2))-methyltransferase RlmN [Alphaproteobacteria bacterium]